MLRITFLRSLPFCLGLLTLVSCTKDLSIEVVVPPELAASVADLNYALLRDSCDGADTEWNRWGSMSGDRPETASGTYFLRVTAVDSSCASIASGCVEVTLPGDGPLVVSLQACAGDCPALICPSGRDGGVDAVIDVEPSDVAQDMSVADGGDSDGGDTDGGDSGDIDGGRPECRQFAAVAVGVSTSCAIDLLGGVWCWGSGAGGQFDGETSAPNSSVPIRISGVTASTELGNDAIAMGDLHVCVIGADDAPEAAHRQKVVCWGTGAGGQTGRDPVEPFTWPQPIDERFGSLTYRAVSTSEVTTCALTVDGKLFCFGGSSVDTTSDRVPAFPVRAGETFDSISVGPVHGCFVETGGQLWCYGNPSGGRLGAPFGSPQPPTLVPDFLVQAASAGLRATCTLVGGALRCFGDRYEGSAAASMRLGILDFTAISMGDDFGCGITGSEVACWGSGADYRLGNGTTADRDIPLPITGAFTSVVAGEHHACALTTAGYVECWGDNAELQAGVAGGVAVQRPGMCVP